MVVVSEVKKLMGNSETQKEDTVSALMDGVLLLAIANQELNYRRRELIRPQLNKTPLQPIKSSDSQIVWRLSPKGC